MSPKIRITSSVVCPACEGSIPHPYMYEPDTAAEFAFSGQRLLWKIHFFWCQIRHPFTAMEHLAPCALGHGCRFNRRHTAVWDSRSSRCSQEFDTGTSPAPLRGRQQDGKVAEVSGGQDHGANVTISENAELQDSMIEEIVQVRFTVSSPPHRRVVAAESSSSSRHLYHRVQEHFR